MITIVGLGGSLPQRPIRMSGFLLPLKLVIECAFGA